MERGGRPKGSTKKRKAIYQREYDLFVKRLMNDPHVSDFRKERTRKAVCLLFNGGFRVSELTRLTCLDICDAVFRGEISLKNDTKTKTGRNVFFSKKSREEIKRLFENEIEYCSDQLVFHGRGGSYSFVNSASFTYQLNKLLKKHLNGNYTTHSFRAGYITEVVKDFNPKMAQAMIGHKSINTTLRYTEITEDDLKNAIEDIR